MIQNIIVKDHAHNTWVFGYLSNFLELREKIVFGKSNRSPIESEAQN